MIVIDADDLFPADPIYGCAKPSCKVCHPEGVVWLEEAELEGKRRIKPAELRAIKRREQDVAKIMETADRTPHVTEFEDLVDVLPDLAAEYRELQSTITAAEERKKEIGSEIKAMMDALSLSSVRGDSWVAIRSRDTITRTLSDRKLLENGVAPDVIKASYEERPRAGYVQVKGIE